MNLKSTRKVTKMRMLVYACVLFVSGAHLERMVDLGLGCTGV